MSTPIPIPPPELVQRVGRIDEQDVVAAYEAIGRGCRARIERLLPSDWAWEDKRVLDFGCGAGRTLRHFLEKAQRGEFHGCDIDGPSIAWLAEHLSPPLHVFQNGERPPLPQPAGYFDLVYAFSVFTHLTDHWAVWLLELHRVLKPAGLLFATFLNAQLWDVYGKGVWDEDRVGMNVTKTWNPWESGGPIVFHSEWWIREHWGRAFEVLQLERENPDDPMGQGAVLLRRRPERLARADLERAGDDPRELAALRFNIEQLEAEADELFAQRSELSRSHAVLAGTVGSLQTEVERLRAELAVIGQSRSWRLTAPLRGAAAIVRRRNG